MGVQRVQFLFHLLRNVQRVNIPQPGPTILVVAHRRNEPDIFGRLFRRYFLQIFDLLAF